MLIRYAQIETEQGPSSSVEPTAEAEFVPILVPSNAVHDMNVKRPRMYIAELCPVGQSKEGELNNRTVVMPKQLEGFIVGRGMDFETVSTLGKRRSERY